MTTSFVNGTFDVLHIGHIRLLKHAAETADRLIVAIDSDIRVKKLKGFNRPFNCQDDRAEMLMALRYVSEVLIFNSDEELSLMINKIKPDLMIVGSDWAGKNIIGAAGAKEIRFFDRIEEYSTTKILENNK